MKRKTPLSTQLYQALFPFRAEGIDPSSFSEHVRKNLLPELRTEVRMFYGEELADTLEARFPGLDYTNRVHRFRLSRFPHHCKLFLTFDKLGWTEQEIYHFCDWEGTILVKQKYESFHGKIRDTAADYIYHEPKFLRRPSRILAHASSMRGGGGHDTLVSRESSPSSNDPDDEEDLEYNDAESSRPQSSGERQPIQSHSFDPQSALNMARQALLASRSSTSLATQAASSMRSTLWRDREAPVPGSASRSSRVESARAAA